MGVIKEINQFTSLTGNRKIINKLIANSLTEQEQREIVPLLRDMLSDELLHVIAIMKVEKEKMKFITGEDK